MNSLTRSALIAGVMTLIAAFSLTFVTPVPTAHAQILTDFSSWRPVAVSRVTDTADVKLLVRYVGTNASGGTVTVAGADGNLTLSQGAVASSTGDATVKCPAGAAAGVIDVSDAACNTLGEVINIINASANWVAVPLDGLLSDDMDCAASAGCLATRAEVTASLPEGVGLLTDIPVALNTTIALVPSEARRIDFYISGSAGTSAVLKRNPFSGYRTFVASQLATATFTGTLNMTISTALTTFLRSSTTESVTSLYGPVAGGATGVSKTFIALGDPVKVLADSDQRVILRLTATTTLSAITHTALGYRAPYPR